MIKFVRFTTAAGLAATLAACNGALHQAEIAAPPTDPFAKALHKGYVALARAEHDENDFTDAAYFAERGLAAAKGAPPKPDRLSHRKLPGETVADLATARKNLSAALNAGAHRHAPAAAADAQIAFDCWMQEQEENLQPFDIADCRGKFSSAMARLQTRPLAVLRESRPRPVPAVLTAPAARAPLATKFVVYFDFDSAEIAPTSEADLARAADAARRIGAALVRVSGHADRAGPEAHNLALSRQRARQVVDALRRVGLPDVSIATLAFGEEKPAVRTPNGSPEARNRRVEIELTH